MKEVSSVLGTHLNTSKRFMSCDLYEFQLKSGINYYYADTDRAVAFGGKTYRHDGPIVTRTQIKTASSVSVDKLTVTINSVQGDTMGGVPIMAVAHNGGFDGCIIALKRAFFDDEGNIIDVLHLFKGEGEVKSGGGLTVQLEVKSIVQRLNTEYPNRRYYPQCPYTVYDSDCGVDINLFRQRVRVVSVPEVNTIVVSGSHPNSDYYTAGGIDWISGNLTGQSTQVLEHKDGKLYFMNPKEAQPHIGDECYIYAGCDKTPETCKNRFNNFSRNCATPYVPLKESIR